MERLREQREASDPIVVEAAKLLVELAPAEDEAGRKERVRRSIAAQLGGRRRRVRAWILVPATALIALAAFAAERVWSSREKPDQSSPEPAATEIENAAERVAPVERTDPKPEPQVTQVKAKAKLKPKPKQTSISAAPEVEVTSPREPARDDETLLLVESVRTLRREHRPEAASALLEEYLRRYPDGALREEGLALAVEAAWASKNQTRAAELAREYIAQYPAGRFRAQADAAISGN